MPYSTLTQLTDRFGERLLADLTDRGAEATGGIDEAVVDRAIADTDALIDGYLKGRYLLPLDTVPPLVTDMAQAITIYKLHVHVVSDKVRADYQDAMKTLGQIANGSVRLDVAGVEPASSGAAGVQVNDRTRDMTPENLKGFI